MRLSLVLVFGHKPKRSDMIVLHEKSGGTKMITSYPERGMNVWTKFHGNPSNSRRDISLKITNVNLIMVLQETP